MKSLAPIISLHDLIFEASGIDLPIGSGTGLSLDNPVKILSGENYVHNEYEIFKFYLRYLFSGSVEWDFVSQNHLIANDKHIECIELSLCDLDDISKDEWTEKYYFDITDCLKTNGILV